jgi:hypothetical protein
VFVCAEDVSAMCYMQESSFWEVSLTGLGPCCGYGRQCVWMWESEEARGVVPG